MDEETRKTVWLIRAQDGHGKTQVGSGVVICLKERESKKKRNYLLTSAHLVKHFVPSGDGYVAGGRTLSQAVCWPHGGGFVEWEDLINQPEVEKEGVWVGELLDPYDRPLGEWSSDDCSPEKDWVLFDVSETDFQNKDAASFSNEILEPLSIVGFPKGIGDLKGGHNIRNRVSPNFKVDREHHNPKILQPEGNWPVGPGMSGGGVFNSDQNLVAIYRGQDRGHLSTCSIKIQAIRDELLEPSVLTRNLPPCDLILPASDIRRPPADQRLPPVAGPEDPVPNHGDGEENAQVRLTPWQMLALFAFCAILAVLSYNLAPLISSVAAALMMAIGTFGFLRSVAHYESRFGRFGAAAGVAMSTLIIAVIVNPPTPRTVDLKGTVYLQVGDEERELVRSGTVRLLGSMGANATAESISDSGYFEFLSLRSLPGEQRLEFLVKGTPLESTVSDAVQNPLGDYEFTLQTQKIKYEQLGKFLIEVVDEMTEIGSVTQYSDSVRGDKVAIDDIKLNSAHDRHGLVIHNYATEINDRTWKFALTFSARSFEADKEFGFEKNDELQITGDLKKVERSGNTFKILVVNCNIRKSE